MSAKSAPLQIGRSLVENLSSAELYERAVRNG